MGAAIRQFHIAANDVRPFDNVPRFQPRIVRLHAAAPRRRPEFSWITLLAGALALCGIFMLGGLTGMVLWFTYDAHDNARATVRLASAPVAATAMMPIVTMAPPVIAPVSRVTVDMPTAPAAPDIALPAESLAPPPAAGSVTVKADDAAVAAIVEKIAASDGANIDQIELRLPPLGGRRENLSLRSKSLVFADGGSTPHPTLPPRGEGYIIIFHDAPEEGSPVEDADALADRGQKLAQEGRAAEAIASFDRA
ncbi:MAG: hypothetical protein SFW62_03880, partial [Alphaproteobacteria bacterium]|nr:hypothetical protein [Alphaproteobacteria bacterium]